jgi:hypothetical protein
LKVLVTGAKGQHVYEIVALPRNEPDITDPGAVEKEV